MLSFGSRLILGRGTEDVTVIGQVDVGVHIAEERSLLECWQGSPFHLALLAHIQKQQ